MVGYLGYLSRDLKNSCLVCSWEAGMSGKTICALPCRNQHTGRLHASVMTSENMAQIQRWLCHLPAGCFSAFVSSCVMGPIPILELLLGKNYHRPGLLDFAYNQLGCTLGGTREASRKLTSNHRNYSGPEMKLEQTLATS